MDGGAGALGGVLVDPSSALDALLVRGFGDWIFVGVCFATAGGDSSSDDSDSDSDDDSEDEPSLLSRNWNTSGTFFCGSTG